MNVSKVIYKCREPILRLPVSNLSSILTLSLVEQELLILPEHMSSLPVFSWVPGADPVGGAPGARPPLKFEKI
jgi:hypothetical protein